MKSALSEYFISGVINNIPLLKLVLENKNFIGGNYDINFIEEYLLAENNGEIIVDNPDADDFENAAVILASILKTKSAPKETSHSKIITNRWLDQLYE
jgi:pyruvate carboxylase